MRGPSRWWLAVCTLLAAGLLAGCSKKGGDEDEEEDRPHNPLMGAPQVGSSGLRRVVDKVKARNELSNLAKLYHLFIAEYSRAPRTLDEFKDYIKRDAGVLHKRLSDGYYTLVLVKKPSSNVVLAYEKVPDAKGGHIVARGDGSVTEMTTPQLTKALKTAE